MENLNCSVVHLGHSTILVETPKYKMIFDYFNDGSVDSKEGPNNGVLNEGEFRTEKDIFVFASHGHGDHYHPVIFKWRETNPNIHYILSSDIETTEEKGVHHMSPYEDLKIGDVRIKTYGSTDKGVSFLVNVEGVQIFHAGDLNWWHWKSFTQEQLQAEEVDFKREVDKLMGQNIDIAFVPVDPRLEEFYHLAGVYFAETIKPKFLIPIHFRDQFSIGKDFGRILAQSTVNVPKFKHIGQKFIF
ncbi:MBL fold metallo-hydrolase [Alkaliphilus oremlandii]|uniref:Putative metal dependent hydrolase n=1 Tax=Alkaliphilus oremlandii (strain OhILAs) TaxID=350688 RepID=A8MFR6_ALKOO|nr:MBL fold metallo-hydrolase [Alkaliphilus oremlandii]ABW17705.1 putative metal dependent hydrolase [Alkaliphilus oremlandii OhILAs]